MDTNVLVSIIIAVIAILPGIWALVNLASKDKLEERFDMLRSAQYSISAPLQAELAKLQTRTIFLEEETTTEKLYKKMYEKPVVIRCEHCRSPNVIASLNCIRCGAPLDIK
jgi:hypothetical protein